MRVERPPTTELLIVRACSHFLGLRSEHIVSIQLADFELLEAAFDSPDAAFLTEVIGGVATFSPQCLIIMRDGSQKRALLVEEIVRTDYAVSLQPLPVFLRTHTERVWVSEAAVLVDGSVVSVVRPFSAPISRSLLYDQLVADA